MLLYLAVDNYKLSQSLEPEVVKCVENLMSLVQDPFTIVHMAHFLYEKLGDRGRDMCCAAARSTHRKLALIMAKQRAKDILFADSSLWEDVLHHGAMGLVASAASSVINRDGLLASINGVIQP